VSTHLGVTSTPDLLSTGEVAEHLGISRATVRRAVATGKLHASMTPGHHLRFTWPEVGRFAKALDEGTVSETAASH
jgi:excisionase family DNA binding protein